MCMRDLSLSDGFSYYCNESFHIHIMRFFFTLKSDRCLVVVQSFLSTVDPPSSPPFFSFFFFFVSSSSLRRTKRKSSPLLAFFPLSCRNVGRTSNRNELGTIVGNRTKTAAHTHDNQVNRWCNHPFPTLPDDLWGQERWWNMRVWSAPISKNWFSSHSSIENFPLSLVNMQGDRSVAVKVHCLFFLPASISCSLNLHFTDLSESLDR